MIRSISAPWLINALKNWVYECRSCQTKRPNLDCEMPKMEAELLQRNVSNNSGLCLQKLCCVVFHFSYLPKLRQRKVVLAHRPNSSPWAVHSAGQMKTIVWLKSSSSCSSVTHYLQRFTKLKALSRTPCAELVRQEDGSEQYQSGESVAKSEFQNRANAESYSTPAAQRKNFCGLWALS